MGYEMLTNQLYGYHKDCFEGELPITEIKQVFKTGTQQFQH